MSTSLKTTSAAHLTEGKFLLREKTLNMGQFMMYLTGTRRSTFSKTQGRNLATVNWNKEQRIEVMPHLV
jgi:hypothetical protein